MIYVSGDSFGYLAADREYEGFHLVVEYCWGKKTDGGKFVRNLGIFPNAIGPNAVLGANGCLRLNANWLKDA